MSGIFREVLTFPQRTGDIRLVVIGDEKYARYETVDGFTVIYEPERDEYVYAALSDFGQFTATNSPASGPPPPRTPQHLMEDPEVRSFIRRERFAAMLPSGPPGGALSIPRSDDRMFTFGPSGGLLPGRQLTSGNVVGLTILVTFPDAQTSTTVSEVDALLNAANYRGNGNFASVNGYFKLMSSGKLNYTNRVVGPFQLSRPRMFYSLKANEGRLVPEVLQLALNANVDFSQFDSQGENIVDALSIMYAGQTIYQGDLWPHNWVHDTDVGQGIRTELYTITSMGRMASDLSIGTFCHEAGHMLCRFPDLYDYGRIEREGDDFESAGIGYFCAMGGGNHLNRGKTPAPIISYLRDLVGWCDEKVELNNGGQFSIASGDYGKVFKYATTKPTEYFLVENRSAIDLDAFLPASGLAVYHCDTRGSNEFQQGSQAKHYQAALLQADGHRHLESGTNQGDSGDLFGTVAGTAISHATNPATTTWSGAGSGLIIRDIGAPGREMTFSVGEVPVVSTTLTGAVQGPLPIPENNPVGLTSAIHLDAPGVVRELNLEVVIKHTFRGDLKVELVSPTGRRITLHNRTGGGTDNLSLVLNAAPPSVLSPMIGQSITGDWLLRVYDLAARDTGALERWSITVVPGS